MHRLKTEVNFEKQKRCSNDKAKRFLNSWEVAAASKKSLNPMNFENVVKAMREKKLKAEQDRYRKNYASIQRYEEQIHKINKLQELKRNEILERGIYRNIEITKKQIFVLENLRE
jgi:hypothetical protein